MSLPEGPSSQLSGDGDPREGSREIHDGIIVSEAMDWCKKDGAIVPYRLWAKQIQAGNLANSVRQTDDRSHVAGSIVLVSHGDAPGASGINSGTNNAECTPKTWSETVRAENRNMVRHDDLWWMNHRNTYGRLTYVKDPNSYPTIDPQLIKARMQVADAGNQQYAQEFFLRPTPWYAPEEVLPRLGPRLVPRIPPRLVPRPGPDPGPEPKPGPYPPAPGLRVTGCRSQLICFESGEYDEKEYRKQLKIQQDGINAKTACQNVADIARFDAQSEDQKKAQRRIADDYKKRTFLPQYLEANPGTSMTNMNALHRIDMVAGGYEKDFAGVGDAGVNKSVGAEWPADSRKGQLIRYADEMCKKGCRMSVTLDICESAPDDFDPEKDA